MDIKELLIQAIENAKGFRNCEYISSGAAQCVIAQLYVLCGGAVEDMEAWTIEEEYGDINTVNAARIPDFENTVLSVYDKHFLNDLQSVWDNGSGLHDTCHYTEDESRQYMKNLVNSRF